ncbi:MAG: hypothetical protein A2Z11_00150 [Candidatus Woykebacteria bacterium RBG_16_43_9]|uniref:Uncharacterized protein n=1 Tax=Candidatus Woykebacteria bacterium RBG_16_43_9 TaxID=1802596 RepID=A0A1G1WH55_9BACT|nr:MAG: hypothetical protein A2Z11_00150 [Candidatus Woykebacteria bacterium RBG_16_43_9]
MNKNLVTILLLTLITISVWVAFQVFKVATSNTIPQPTQEQLQELDPELDREVIEDLKNSL